jgi:hypothetical protein
MSGASEAAKQLQTATLTKKQNLDVVPTVLVECPDDRMEDLPQRHRDLRSI